jgi:hypothetical protein
MIVDLYFIAVVHRHPLFAWFEGNPDEDSGVVILIAHLVDHVDLAIPHLATRPIKQTHSSVGADQTVFHAVPARTNMLPARQVPAVEELLPLVRVACANILIFIGRERERNETHELQKCIQ